MYVILIFEYHAVKSVFDGRNPPWVDEIAFAMKILLRRGVVANLIYNSATMVELKQKRDNAFAVSKLSSLFICIWFL